MEQELFPTTSSSKNSYEVTVAELRSHVKINAAAAYLISLQSAMSRKKMRYFLQNVAKIITSNNNILDCNWGAMRRHHVQAILDILIQSKRAPSTINTYLSALKGVAHEAWALEQIETDHYQHIKKIKSVRGERLPKGRALNPQELKQLFWICDQDTSAKGVRDSAILAVLVGCGLRRSELVGLNISSVIWSQSAIALIGKGNKERMAYMPESTLNRLKKWVLEVRGDTDGPLFTRIRRFDDIQYSRMTDQAIYGILKDIAKIADVSTFSPHDLRRTFANQLLDHGVDVMTVKDMMGHNTITTTQKYIRIKDDKMQRASQFLDF